MSVQDDADALVVLSHIDQDHVNGLAKVIEVLRSRGRRITVVLPLLDLWQRLMAIGDGSPEQLRMVANPRAEISALVGPEGRVIEVSPAGEDGGGSEPAALTEIPGTRWDSGTIVRPLADIDWVFHFVLPEVDPQKQRDFEAALGGQRLLDLTALSGDQEELAKAIRKDLSAIRRAVRGLRLKHGPNETSLVVYSGPLAGSRYLSASPPHPACRTCCGSDEPPGMIHTGDAPFNSGRVYARVRAELVRYRDFVGTVDLPHHGSSEGYCPEFIQDFQPLHVIAASGPRKGWDHPDRQIWASLADMRVHTVHVTRFEGSAFNQSWFQP